MGQEVYPSPNTQYSVVDLSDNSTTVYNGPAQLIGVHIQDTISAHAVPFTDNGTTIFKIPSAAEGGKWYEGGNMRFGTALVVDPDDSGTGTVTVCFIADHNGQAGDGPN